MRIPSPWPTSTKSTSSHFVVSGSLAPTRNFFADQPWVPSGRVTHRQYGTLESARTRVPGTMHVRFAASVVGPARTTRQGVAVGDTSSVSLCARATTPAMNSIATAPTAARRRCIAFVWLGVGGARQARREITLRSEYTIRLKYDRREPPCAVGMPARQYGGIAKGAECRS